MPIWFPPEGADNDPVWWEALRRVAALTRRAADLPTLHPCEFMFMGRVDRRRRASIWLYKHIWSRRYINLDDAGHAYRYIPPLDLMSDRPGRYVVRRGLLDALIHLELDAFGPDDRHKCVGCSCYEPVASCAGDAGRA